MNTNQNTPRPRAPFTEGEPVAHRLATHIRGNVASIKWRTFPNLAALPGYYVTLIGYESGYPAADLVSLPTHQLRALLDGDVLCGALETPGVRDGVLAGGPVTCAECLALAEAEGQ
jgi:hypothetical protein